MRRRRRKRNYRRIIYRGRDEGGGRKRSSGRQVHRVEVSFPKAGNCYISEQKV